MRGESSSGGARAGSGAGGGLSSMRSACPLGASLRLGRVLEAKGCWRSMHSACPPSEREAGSEASPSVLDNTGPFGPQG